MISTNWRSSNASNQNWDTLVNQEMLAEEVTVSEACTVIAIANCNIKLDTAISACVQFNVSCAYFADVAEVPIDSSTNSDHVTIITMGSLPAEIDTITFNINPIMISPSGGSIITNRSRLSIIALCR